MTLHHHNPMPCPSAHASDFDKPSHVQAWQFKGKSGSLQHKWRSVSIRLPCESSAHHAALYLWNNYERVCILQGHTCLHSCSVIQSAVGCQVFVAFRQLVKFSQQRCLFADGQVYFPWASKYPSLAALAGSCSMFVSTNDTYTDNSAFVSGGVIFTSNSTSTTVHCSLTSTTAPAMQDLQLPCLESTYANNIIAVTPNSSAPEDSSGLSDSSGLNAAEASSDEQLATSDSAGQKGYGAQYATPPATLLVAASSNASYVSNGDALPQIDVTVLDQFGQEVTLGIVPFFASASVTVVPRPRYCSTNCMWLAAFDTCPALQLVLICHPVHTV